MEDETSKIRKLASTIFDGALELPEEERAAYIERVCSGHNALRQRVEALMRAHKAAGLFMEHSAVAPMTQAEILAMRDQSGERIGRYKLMQQIGEGGCGLVYLAEQEEPIRRRVALKIIKPGMDTRQVIARFEAERQALALLDHPNIAKIYDAGATETGRPYFVMELVDGLRITDHCDRNQLTTSQREELFVQVCQGIQHAHQRGVIHRDLKPTNVLVATVDGAAVPKVIDFGIAKATGNQRLTDKTLFTSFEQFIGTPTYMSPEQAGRGRQEVDTRTDIYSLGVLLYELLAGQTPFDEAKLKHAPLDEVMTTIREHEPARPSTRLFTSKPEAKTRIARDRQIDPIKLAHELRGDLDWIVMKAMEKDRARRYATAGGLADDVKRHLRQEAVMARPPGILYRFQKVAGRNRKLLTGIVMTMTALLVGLGFTWGWLKHREARRQIVMEEASNIRLRQEVDAEANLARAAELVRSQDYAAAENLLNSISEELVKDDSRLPGIRRTLGWHHAFQNRWLPAASNLNDLVQFDRRARNLEAASIDALYCLPILIETGDTNIVETFRRNALSDFSSASEPPVITRLYRICLLSPSSSDVIAQLDRLQEPQINAVRDNANVDDHWYCFNAGLLDYRRGNYTNAARACRRSLGYANATYMSRVFAQILLAMSNFQLGRTNEANVELAYVRETVDQNFRDGAHALAGTAAQPTTFFDWEAARVLLREAVGLVGNTPPGDSSLHTRVDEQFKRVDDLRVALHLEGAETALANVPTEALILEGKRAGNMIRGLGWNQFVNGSRPQASINWSVVAYGPDGLGGMMEGRDLCDFYLSYGPLLVELGDLRGYEKMRRAALTKFGETKDPLKAEPLLLSCLLAPGDVATLAQLEMPASIVANAKPVDTNWTPRILDSLALLAYRRGEEEKCMPLLEKSVESDCRCPTISARTHVLKALVFCEHRQRYHAEVELALCRNAIENGFDKGRVVIGIDDSGVWYDWWIDNMLLREVMVMLQSTATPSPPPK